MRGLIMCKKDMYIVNEIRMIFAWSGGGFRWTPHGARRWLALVPIELPLDVLPVSRKFTKYVYERELSI